MFDPGGTEKVRAPLSIFHPFIPAMKGFAIAALVLFVIILGVYFATRGLPGPNPPTGPCRTASDCPAPQVCIAGVCTDTALPGLILAAQGAIGGLYGSLQNLEAALTGVYLQDALGLQAAATNMGLSSPALGNLQADLATGQKGVASVLAYYDVPGCDPSVSDACGYYAQMMAMTPATPGGVIIAVASSAPGAVAELPMATAAFQPIAADLSNLVSAVQAEAEAAGLQLSQSAQDAIGAVEGDVAALNDAASSSGTLASQATAVTQTGYALYSHMLP